MSKFTPGPWRVEDVPRAGLEISARVDIGKEDMSDGVLQPIYHVSLEPAVTVNIDGTVTATIAFESYRQFPSVNFKAMQRANANLIAAAPELYDVMDRVCRECMFIDDDDGYQNACEICDIGKVLRKARGER